jgi:hypothetical protein
MVRSGNDMQIIRLTMFVGAILFFKGGNRVAAHRSDVRKHSLTSK